MFPSFACLIRTRFVLRDTLWNRPESGARNDGPTR